MIETAPARPADRRIKTFVIGLIIGVGVGSLLMVQIDPGRHEASARVDRGKVDKINVDGSAIVLNGEGYGVGDRPWKDLGGSWHDGGPIECLPPLSSGAQIELGVIRLVADDDGWASNDFAVWVRCLSPPETTETL